MKISFITTVFNEEKTVSALLDSLAEQSRMPDEVIIVDAMSTDNTVESIKYYVSSIKGKERFKKITFKIIEKRGNRAVGRNEAIKKATGNIIVCSDAGCVLDKDWVKNITAPFSDPTTDVVAGYYAGKAETVFKKCLVPYVLVMPDRVDPKNFLPATRSMAFRKSVWEKVGGFPEEYSHNEDYVFAKKLKNIGAHFVFAKDAIVYWKPRKNLQQAFVMFFRFAYGDAQARILRPKVAFLFARYLLGFLLLLSYFFYRSPLILTTVYVILAAYVAWSIKKNYRYVNDWRGIFILPMLQLVSDMAVLTGTVIGFFVR